MEKISKKRVDNTMKFDETQAGFSDLEKEYMSLFKQSPYLLLVINAAGECVRVNEAGLHMNEWTRKEIINQKIEHLTDIYDEKAWDEVTSGNVSYSEKAGSVDYAHSYVYTWIPTIIEGKVAGAVVLGMKKSAAECSEQQDEVYRLANEDPLTNLPNRRCFMNYLENKLHHAASSKEKLAVLFIDLDRFKYVNDTLGHLFGDRVLKHIAERLQAHLPEKSMIARLGGDEFVVVMTDVKVKEEPVTLTEDLLTIIREPLIMDGFEFTLTGSVGIALSPENGIDAEALLTSADAAMYRAKAKGSDRLEVYNRDVYQEFSRYFHVENDLRKAIDRGEFDLYYQPQFCLESGDVCGEEVLVRWKHPIEGTISPGEFISIAEETGLIIPIGEWILREACRQKAKWINEGYPKVPMSVNLSLKQFLQHNIVHTIEKILKETKLPPEYLDLEITESVTVDLDRTLDILNQLIKVGVRISLDDFGTGYSSLQYVGQLPVHELKIDQSFVKKIGKGKEGEAIISMIIHLGRSLELKVIAEGVETKEQLDFLQKQGCDLVQGYYYAKPLSTEEYEQYLRYKDLC
ncbi:hypothetical protein BTR22_01605 [Alkalihalophilus pseudofirmus]|nr:hypothetical protein BTR22_01605 [Alkalihalophilus pseudofirmus]